MSDLDRPSLSDLITLSKGDIDSRITGASSGLPRSVLGVLARIWAALIHGLYGYLDGWYREFFASSAQLTLARHGSEWGLSQGAATFASGHATVTGVNTTVIPAGTQLQRVDQAIFEVTADATIAGGSATLSIEAVASGLAGNTPTGQVLTFVSPVSGAASTATVSAPGLTGGADAEGKEAFRARILDRKRKPPQGGAADDYIEWAKRVAGVTRVWVYPAWSGLGTVGVTFVMDGRLDPIPDGPAVAAVQAMIDGFRPVTADAIVFAPVADPLDLEIHLTPDTPEIRASVSAALADLLTLEGVPGGTILLTHIDEAISGAAGEVDHVLVTPAANVTHAAGHMPTLGTIDWGV